MTDTHYAIPHFFPYRCVWLDSVLLTCYWASMSEHCGTLLVL